MAIEVLLVAVRVAYGFVHKDNNKEYLRGIYDGLTNAKTVLSGGEDKLTQDLKPPEIAEQATESEEEKGESEMIIKDNYADELGYPQNPIFPYVLIDKGQTAAEFFGVDPTTEEGKLAEELKIEYYESAISNESVDVWSMKIKNKFDTIVPYYATALRRGAKMLESMSADGVTVSTEEVAHSGSDTDTNTYGKTVETSGTDTVNEKRYQEVSESVRTPALVSSDGGVDTFTHQKGTTESRTVKKNAGDVEYTEKQLEVLKSFSRITKQFVGEFSDFFMSIL